MADERRQASVSPFPGGDVGLILFAVVGATALAAGSILLVYLIAPEKDRGELVAKMVEIFTPTLVALLAYLKGHANGNAAQEIKEKADDAAVKAQAAVRVAAETSRKLDDNTALTAETKEAVAKVLNGGGGVEQHGPRGYRPPP